ncbi:MAG: AAA family ATPase [Blastocatellia bacterium]|nr:AAA family ATPase [Blastocatellia bacterium]
MPYRFFEFSLDAEQSRLSRHGEDLEVQPKVFQALLYLVERRGQLVTKEELVEALWPDTAVSDESLSQIIHKLRRAIGDDGEERRLVQTVPKRGFRFLPEITGDEPQPAVPAVEPAVVTVSVPAEPVRKAGFPAEIKTESGFLGRERELAQLVRHYQAALSGICQFALVGGPSGSGKTVLVERFEGLLLETPVRVLHGRFIEQDQSFPYNGFCEVILEYFHTFSPTEKSGQPDFGDLAPGLRALFPALSEISALRSPADPDSGSAPRLKPDDRTSIFETLARTLLRIANGGPLVVVLEDLHAADISLEALHYIIRRLGAVPIFFVGTCRSEEVDKRHPLNRLLAGFSGDKRFLQLALGPFSLAEHRSQLEMLLKDNRLDPALIERTFETTEGNPYFTRELVRALKDLGRISQDGTGVWCLTVESGLAETLPATIQQAVEDRVDRLPETVRDILSTASILGKTFDYRDLVKLYEDPDAVDDAVETLVRQGFFNEGWEAHSDTLSFSSGVLRDVLYANLSRRKRKNLHRRYAATLETRFAGRLDRVLSPLVYHFAQADIPEKVVAYGLRLAQRSLEAFSVDEALRAARTVLEFLDEETGSQGVAEGQARSILAAALRMIGRMEPALKEYESAIDAFLRENQRGQAIQTMLLAAETAWQARKIDQTKRWTERGMAAARAAFQDDVLIRLLTLGASVAALRGEHDQSRAYLEEVTGLKPKPVATPAPATVQTGGILRVALTQPVNARHPALIELNEEAEVFANFCETLVTVNDQGIVLPHLCETWEAQAEARQFVFHLHPAATFQDGTPCTATAVIASFHEAAHRSAGQLPEALTMVAGMAEFLHGTSARITGLQEHSPLKFSVSLTASLPLFPVLLTDIRTGIVRVQPDSKAEPVGTGPFRLQEWNSGTIVLERHAAYWKGTPPHLDRLVFETAQTAGQIAHGLKCGEFDLGRDLPPDVLDEVLRHRPFRPNLVEAPKKSVYFVAFSQTGRLAHFPELRRALLRMVNVADLVWRTLGRFAQPAEGLFPPQIAGFTPGITASPTENPPPPVSLATPPTLRVAVHPILQERFGALTDAILQTWAGTGREIRMVTPDMASYQAAKSNPVDVDVVVGRWIASYDDPDAFVYGLFHSHHGILRHVFSLPELDRLLEQARAITLPAERERIYRSFEQELLGSAWFFPLFHEIDYRVAGPTVRSLHLGSTPPFVNYGEIWKAQALVETDTGGRRGGQLAIALTGTVQTLDPAFCFRVAQAEVVPNVFEPLTRVTEGLQVLPWLAADFHSEDGGRRFRFRLREAVRFHNGRRLTARDVRFSFERLLANRETEHRDLLAPICGARAILNGQARDLTGFTMISSQEFTLDLEEPLSFFPAILSCPSTSIVPEGSGDFSGTWKAGCVGTGPFRVQAFEPHRRLELEANPQYWRTGIPYPDRISYSFRKTPAEIAVGFQEGRYSLAWDLVPAEVEALRQRTELGAQYRETPRPSTYYLAFNIHHGPLADEGLRRHLVQQIDLEKLVSQTVGRLAIPAKSLIPPGMPGARATRYVAPRPTLEQPLNLRHELTALVNSSYEGPYAPLAAALFSNLEHIGLSVAKVPANSEYLTRLSGTVDMLLTRWIADYPDADNFAFWLLHSQKGIAGRLCGTPELDRLIDLGRREPSASTRHHIYLEIEDTIAQRALLLPLFHEQSYRLMRPEFECPELNLFAPLIAYEKLVRREEGTR